MVQCIRKLTLWCSSVKIVNHKLCLLSTSWKFSLPSFTTIISITFKNSSIHIMMFFSTEKPATPVSDSQLTQLYTKICENCEWNWDTSNALRIVAHLHENCDNKPYVSHAHRNHEISIAHISKTCKRSQANG